FYVHVVFTEAHPAGRRAPVCVNGARTLSRRPESLRGASANQTRSNLIRKVRRVPGNRVAEDLSASFWRGGAASAKQLPARRDTSRGESSPCRIVLPDFAGPRPLQSSDCISRTE